MRDTVIPDVSPFVAGSVYGMQRVAGSVAVTFENDFLELNTCNDEEAAAIVAEFSHEYLPELGDDDQPGVEAGVEV